MFTKRVALFTGKGGVGRSTLTAAAALAAAAQGLTVLVCEVGDDEEEPSALARHFGHERLPTHPTVLKNSISGVRLLARTGQEAFMRSVLRSATLAKAALSSEALRRLLSAGPSFKEMGVFYQLLGYLKEATAAKTPRYQLVLIDMPATGHTLSLTGLPKLLLQMLPSGPIADALKEGQSYLNDPAKGSAYVVVIPETLPVTECFELLAGLKATNMPVGGVVLNRMPDDVFTSAERAVLEPALATHPVLGLRGFQRPLTAQRERARLVAGVSVPVFEVPELPAANLESEVARLLVDVQPLSRAS